jgi:hypothetical protein
MPGHEPPTGPHHAAGPHHTADRHDTGGLHHTADPHHTGGSHDTASPQDAFGGTGDGELAAIWPVITGASGQFRHREHINLAFYGVRRYGMPDAVSRVCGWIQQVAAYQRAPQKYHHTVSRAWVELVAQHVAEDPGCADFASFAERNPALLDKRLLARHYRSSTLAAAAARQQWVEPDRRPFPQH